MNGTIWVWLGWLGCVGCSIEGPGSGGQGLAGTPYGGSGLPMTTGNPNVIRQAAPWQDFDQGVLAGSLCGVTEDGAVDCPSAAARGIELPVGTFVSVAITGGAEAAGCALGTSGEVVCFDADAGSRLVSESPEGTFIAIAGHSFVYAHACGVAEGGTVRCWGEGIESEPPTDVFQAELSGWQDTWCGLLEHGTISCWGSTGAGSSEVMDGVPDGDWAAVSVGDHYACATSGTDVTCWGDVPGQDAPDEPLAQVRAGELNTCGVRPDGTGVCWGENGWGQLGVPEAEFVDVRPGRGQVCGLRGDGAVECWGMEIGTRP